MTYSLINSLNINHLLKTLNIIIKFLINGIFLIFKDIKQLYQKSLTKKMNLILITPCIYNQFNSS